MPFCVIVLNGTSSSGKSSLARALQARLPDPWLTVSVDDLIAAMPAGMLASDSGFGVGDDGAVTVGDSLIRLNVAWEHGIAAMARAGAPVIVDDLFLRGGHNQHRWQEALGDLPTLWVGLHCDRDELARRERDRGDRAIGMAASQLHLVHAGVQYDTEVDTTTTPVTDCADLIAARLIAGPRSSG